MRESKLGYYFIVMASVIIVMAGVKSASVIVVPFLLSLFLAIILLPSYEYFNKKGLPSSISMLLVISALIILIYLVTKLIGSSIQDLNSNIDLYSERLLIYYLNIVDFAADIGMEISAQELSSVVNTKQIMSFSTNILQSMGSMLTNSFVVLLTVIFMLFESMNFKSKIELAGKNSDALLHLQNITSKIKEYMVLKAVISAVTGIIIWGALVLIGTDYAFLWGLVAFLFNFIPNIGSIIAAVPAVLLTLVQFGAFSAMLVALLYMAINIIVGSIIEPRVMGKGLGLSTLVVFLSLIFWGWLLGIVGMLLSIPLTIMLKIVLDDNEGTRWISIMLGSRETKANQK